jgi:anti-sigma factor RsiW
MDNCTRHEEAISAMMDGELSADQQQGMKDHLAGCESCRKALSQWETLSKAAGDIGEPIPSQWDAVWGRVEKAALLHRAGVRLRREITRGVWLSAAAAAVLLAAFFWAPKKPVINPTVAQAKPAPFEVVDIEVSPDYTPTVMSGQDKDLPVIWLERM